MFWFNCADDHYILNEYDFFYLNITERLIIQKLHNIHTENLFGLKKETCFLGELFFRAEGLWDEKDRNKKFYEISIYFINSSHF